MLTIAVLAGGLATRLYPATRTIPKAIIEVAGRPFIARQLELFARCGIRQAVYCLGHLGEYIEDLVGDGSRFGINVRYSYDGDRLRGTGGAVRRALPMLGDEFLVTYGDSYLDIAYAPVVEAFRVSGAPALMTVFRNDGKWDTSNVVFKDHRILAYDKKGLTPGMRYIDYGLLVMRPEALHGWDGDDAFDLAEVLGGLVTAGRLAGFQTPTRFYEIGTLAGIADLAGYLGDSK